METTETKLLEKILIKADHVLMTSERNEFGEWIGNEHLLLQWTRDIKGLIKNEQVTDNQHFEKLSALLEAGLGTPSDVKKVKQLLSIALEELRQKG